MSEVEWRGRTLPVKIDKARIFLLGLADNEAAIAQVSPPVERGPIEFIVVLHPLCHPVVTCSRVMYTTG
jgi:hypothetical protein